MQLNAYSKRWSTNEGFEDFLRVPFRGVKASGRGIDSSVGDLTDSGDCMSPLRCA